MLSIDFFFQLFVRAPPSEQPYRNLTPPSPPASLALSTPDYKKSTFSNRIRNPSPSFLSYLTSSFILLASFLLVAVSFANFILLILWRNPSSSPIPPPDFPNCSKWDVDVVWSGGGRPPQCGWDGGAWMVGSIVRFVLTLAALVCSPT